MKKIIPIYVLCLIPLGVCAQEKADVLVNYECASPKPTGGREMKKMSLLANARKSLYFNETSLWNDSILSTPGGEGKLNEIIRANCLVMHPDGYQYFDFSKGPVKMSTHMWPMMLQAPL